MAILDYKAREISPGLRDDVAYVLPMAIFLAFTFVGGKWPSLYITSYVAKTIVVALALIFCWRYYTKIRWNHWWLGAIFGVIGIVQWVGMEHLLLHFWPNYPRASAEVFNPFEKFASARATWTFIAVRWAGATLLVPVMEELFWRDYLWRTIQAPNNFKLPAVGEADWQALCLVSLFFCVVHVQWMTAIVWGLLVGVLLIITRSLGACIVMHAVTNFLLGWYVLKSGDWSLW